MLIIRNLNLISVQSWTYLPETSKTNDKHFSLTEARLMSIIDTLFTIINVSLSFH